LPDTPLAIRLLGPPQIAVRPVLISAAMFTRPTCRRRTAWFAILVIAAGLLGSPFANAIAMRAGSVDTDLCSAVSGTGTATMPITPAGSRHTAHAGACECCTGSAPNAAFDAPAAVLPVGDECLTVHASSCVIRRPAFSARVGLARAPPRLS